MTDPKKPPSAAAVGRALGLSPAAVSKLKARGMPVDSVELAAEWRRRNLAPARAKAPPRRPAADLVRRAEALATAALAHCEAGTFAEVGPGLRAALRVIPPDHRQHVRMPPPVWEALCAPLLAALAEVAAADAPRVEMDDADADDMGALYFAFAVGEVRVLEP